MAPRGAATLASALIEDGLNGAINPSHQLFSVTCDNLTFFTSWRIVSRVLDKYETVCAFPHQKGNHKLYVSR
jgi:hypothetical protein